jgi:hypothetical protein
MFTPMHIVINARVVLLFGSLTVAILVLSPLQHSLAGPLAHGLTFGALTSLALVAFPRIRRGNLALSAILLGGSLKAAQFATGQNAPLADWGGEVAGVTIVHFVAQIEALRALAREKYLTSSSEIYESDRRRRPPREKSDLASGASRHNP